MEFYLSLQTYVNGMQSLAAGEGEGEVNQIIYVAAGEDALSLAGGVTVSDCF